jgi:hypothetical protein
VGEGSGGKGIMGVAIRYDDRLLPDLRIRLSLKAN